jgi:hypothetical protein
VRDLESSQALNLKPSMLFNGVQSFQRRANDCGTLHMWKGNILSNPTFLSKPWMGSAVAEKTNYLITMSEDVIWGPEVNWRPSVHQSGWMVHWWFHFFIPMFTKLVSTRWHFFPMLNPNPNFCLVWTTFPSPLPTYIYFFLLNSPHPQI